MIVNNTNLANNGLEAACEISQEDVELQICPEGTALEGVAVNITSPDTTPPDGIPDVCTVSGLEVCPDDTDQAGHFVMGDGDLTTTDELVPLCNLPEAEVCDEGTQLEGILVNNTDAIIDGMEAACNPFEICPENTALAGVAVLDDGDPDTPLPTALCTQNGLEQCPDGSVQAGHFVVGDGDLTTTQITEPEQAGFDPVLAGICNVRDDATATNQCIKCADLAALQGFSDTAVGQNGQIQASIDLIGENSDDANVFSICDNINTAKTEFNTAVALPGGISAQETRIENAFTLCINNVLAQGSTAALQENSLTTNIKSEAEIPSVNTEAQNTNLNALRENPHVKALLENPDLNTLLDNPDSNALLENPDVKALLEDPTVNALLEDPALQAQLEKSQ